MKITDLTHQLYDVEMQRLMNLAQEHAEMLTAVFGRAVIEPVMPAEAEYRFFMAGDIWELWQYAVGAQETEPRYWRQTIQLLTKALWCPLGDSNYDVPADYWQTPLGFICKAAEARNNMSAGKDMTVEEISILAAVSRQAIHKALMEKGLNGRKIEGIWSVPNAEAKRFINNRSMPKKKTAPVPKTYRNCTVEWIVRSGSGNYVKATRMEACGCTVSVKGKTATVTMPDGKVFTKRLGTNGFAYKEEPKDESVL